MATVLTNDDLDPIKKQQDQGQNLSTGAGNGTTITAPGQSPGPKPAAPVAPIAPGQQQAGSSGQFQNLHKFIQANNPGQFGQQFQNKVGQVAQQGQQAINDAGQQFKSQADTAGQQLTQVGQGVQQAGQGLNSNDQTQFDAAAGQLSAGLGAQYTGPQNLANQDQLALQAQQAGAIGQAAGTDSGRFSLLQKFFNKPTYNAGQGRLDNLLLGSQTGAINQIRQQGQQVGTQLNQAEQNAQAQAGTFGQQATDIQNQARDLGNTAETGIQGNLKSDAQKYLDQAEGLYDPNAIKQSLTQQGIKIGDQALTPDQINALVAKNYAGVQGGSLDKTALDALKNGGDLSSIYGQTSADAQAQAGRFNKLSDMLKTGTTYDPSKLLNQGQIGIDDATRTNLEGQLNGQAAGIAGQGRDAAIQKATTDKVDELFRNKYAQQQSENAFRNLNGNGPGGQKGAQVGALTPDQQRVVDQQTAQILAQGGANNWAGDQARTEGNAYGAALQNADTPEGQAFQQQQLAAAKQQALNNILFNK